VVARMTAIANWQRSWKNTIISRFLRNADSQVLSRKANWREGSPQL
jgi:hypothetical protein